MPQLQTQAGMIRVPAGIWTIDPAHSSVGFKIRHLMIANVRGQFSEFDGTVEAAEDDPVNSRVWGTVKVASISTGDPQRDEHLKSPTSSTPPDIPRSRSSPLASGTSTAVPTRSRAT